MEEVTLVAETGRPRGSRPSGRLRASGKVPAVVYGRGTDPVAVAVDARELRAALTTEAGTNAIIRLKVDGETHPTLAREIQRDPVRHSVDHVDFVLVDLTKDVQVDIPIHLHGEAEEVERENGTIEQVLFTLSVTCKPTNIPTEITIDVSGMTIGDTITVGDLSLPDGVLANVAEEEPVATAQITRATMEAEEAAEAAEAEAAEGGEGEGAEGGEAADTEGAPEDTGAEAAEGSS